MGSNFYAVGFPLPLDRRSKRFQGIDTRWEGVDNLGLCTYFPAAKAKFGKPTV